MNSKCEKCGGELIEGLMAGMHGMFFYPDGEINSVHVSHVTGAYSVL